MILFLSTLSLRRATADYWTPVFTLKFLSTLSLRRATFDMAPYMVARFISIHALLAESDEPHQQIIVSDRDFYPRSPCGERRGVAISKVITAVFLSTLSLRRATGRGYQQSNHRSISIHALLAESDRIIKT